MLILRAPAPQFRCHFSLHLLQAVAQRQDRLDSGQVHAQVWHPPPERRPALASSPQGSDTYDSSHYHAVDASGNMTCRTPTSSAVCTSSSQTGAKFTYDVEGRLIRWVSADGSTTVNYGYDGEGQRFEMQVVTSSTTTTTTYISTLEEIQVVGSTTTKIVYFYYNGQRVSEDDNTHWYYPIGDTLSSTTVVVDYTGVIAAQLFAPYGQARWAGGTMPTTYGFTGQHADATTGLDYYGARYYDPAAGTFTSADTASGKGAGLNRYGYVSGNPETLTDPTGHMWGPTRGQGICRYDPDGSECGGNGGAAIPWCVGVATSCGLPGVHNPGKAKSLLRTSGAAKDDSDVLVGTGAWGLQDIINALQLLWDKLTQGELAALGSPNGSSLAGILATSGGIVNFVTILLAAIAPEGSVAAGLVLAGNLLSATLSLVATDTSTNSTWTDTGQAILDAMTQLENFKTQFQEAGGNLDALTFTVTEADTYRTYSEYRDNDGIDYWFDDSYLQQHGTPDPNLFHFVQDVTDYTQIASATFIVNYYYQG